MLNGTALVLLNLSNFQETEFFHELLLHGTEMATMLEIKVLPPDVESKSNAWRTLADLRPKVG